MAAPLGGMTGWGVESVSGHYYPCYQNEDEAFSAILEPMLTSDAMVLDAGCGSGQYFRHRWKSRVRQFIGCDLGSDVRENSNLSAGVVGTLEALPFRNGTFDVVIARYVLEHLPDPGRVFAELARVLKPGGKFVALTPSKHHYVSLISRLIPDALHSAVTSALWGSKTHSFPTFYRANSKRALQTYGERAHLQLIEYRAREYRPAYLKFFLPFFLLGVVYERVVNRFEVLSPFRVNIIAVFERAASYKPCS
jgi:SAM-dependent methyltransferase